MSQSAFVQAFTPLDYTPTVATLAGTVVLLAAGLVGVVSTGLAANQLGAAQIAGVFDFDSASATLFAEGEEVYWDNTNKLAVREGAALASFRLGIATAAKISGATAVRVLINEGGVNAVKSTMVADGTAVTNTVAETIAATFTIPAGSLKAGRILRFLAAILATSTNSTDTFRYRVRLGGLTGTVLADSTAIDLANGDSGVMTGDATIRTDGASGTLVAASQSMLKTTSNPLVIDSTAVDTTAALALVVTITESVASAVNSAKVSSFNVEIV